MEWSKFLSPEERGQLEELMEKEQSGEIFVIAPETLHGVGRTESNPDKLTKLYEEGYQQAKKQMADLKRYLGMEDDAR